MGRSKSQERSLRPVNLEMQVITSLRRIREESTQITQAELARRLGTKHSVISRMEMGHSSPSLRFVEAVARALDVDVTVAFEPRTVPGESSSAPIDTNGRIWYRCLYCSPNVEWESRVRRRIHQCPNCRRRSGIPKEEYEKALRGGGALAEAIRESPPFRKPPPVRGVLRSARDILGPVVKTAAGTCRCLTFTHLLTRPRFNLTQT